MTLEISLSFEQVGWIEEALKKLAVPLQREKANACYAVPFRHDCPGVGDLQSIFLLVSMTNKEGGTHAKSLGAHCSVCRRNLPLKLSDLLTEAGMIEEARIIQITEEMEEGVVEAEQAIEVNTILFNGRTEGTTNPSSK